MSLSSVRNPPPFRDTEDQDPEYRTPEPDSDDGEDIFTGTTGKPFVSTPPETDPSTDIFSEEGTYTVQKHTPANTNGVQSDEELDLFAEATVELTLTTPTSRGRKEIIGPTGPLSTTVNAHGLHSPNTSAVDELDEEDGGDRFELNIAVTNPEKTGTARLVRPVWFGPSGSARLGSGVWTLNSRTPPSSTSPVLLQGSHLRRGARGDGMNAYMTYKVSTQVCCYAPQTTLPAFRSKTFSVRRRFSDFLGLYEKLSVKYNLMGCIIPPPPQKSVVGMTKVKVGKEDPSSAEFVEKRRAALESSVFTFSSPAWNQIPAAPQCGSGLRAGPFSPDSSPKERCCCSPCRMCLIVLLESGTPPPSGCSTYLQRVVSHPALLQDSDVQEFLEREELPRAVNTQALSGPGFLKMINKASDAVNKMTIKMNESDNWFESKLQEVENEEQLLRRLHASVDSLVNHRKELCGNTAVFAKSVAMLGSSEENSALSRALSQLAEVEDKLEQLHQEQAFSDFFILTELLADYVRLLGAVRGCFEQRMKAWQRWQEAQSTLQKKREAEAKLLWANKPDKLQQAKEDIAEVHDRTTTAHTCLLAQASRASRSDLFRRGWEAKVGQCERDFERISSTLRKEVHRFEKEKCRDFKHHIVKYLESLLRSQHRLVKCWEAFLPEARAIV
ncbi:hypothetical protein NFI96_030016 [Prochilodus magdalenae]|nr:hypothetical protein NFI96_030016 [Prochilodus magdalenae]